MHLVKDHVPWLVKAAQTGPEAGQEDEEDLEGKNGGGVNAVFVTLDSVVVVELMVAIFGVFSLLLY